jgi:hypothetical protein
MHIISPVVLGISLALAGGSLTAAQDATATPPKVIQIQREWLKAGKSFIGHEKAEAAFANLSARAKLQGHYVALDAMSGKARTLYIARYPSFEAWEQDNKIVDKTPALTAEIDRDIVGTGEFVEGIDSAVFTYEEELSYHPHPDLSHARYYQIDAFHVRLGHAKEWREVVKMYQEACDKADNGAHWGMYGIMYGGEGGTYIALSHRSSLKEEDEIMAGGGKFVEAMGGPEAMEKFDQLLGQAVDSWHTELFSINPRESYADEAWVKGDPEFWKPKAKAPQAAAAKPAAAKPVATARSKPSGQ